MESVRGGAQNVQSARGKKVEVCFLNGWFILPDGAARCT